VIAMQEIYEAPELVEYAALTDVTASTSQQ
jgi:hypothetical protein